MRRFGLKALALVAVFIAITLAAAYVYLRRSLPVINGEVMVGGASAPIEIIRDADAVTHVFASTKPDALFGLGYAHAQDRLWQMEFQRRIGHGRLSEIFGAVTIPQDRFLRTVGFGRAGQRAWERLPEDAKRQLNAYVAGVNAFIASHHGGALPPEFSLLGASPEPWTGADVLAWVKMMAWDLSRNYSSELLRHDVLGAVGPDGLAELFPPYPDDGLSILSVSDMEWLKHGHPASVEETAARESRRIIPPVAGGWSAAVTSALDGSLPAVRDVLLGARIGALGSNNWVVDGTMSASGKPLLANDPHLGAQVPSLWYLAHLSAGEFDVIGATLPGTPVVAIGRNRLIAWGETNVAADVEDLYRERLDPTGRFAEFQGAWEPLQLVPEVIAVKGGSPLRVEVRISRHGPIVSDAINANNAVLTRAPKPGPLAPLALRWTGLDPDDMTIVAFMHVNASRNWTDFTAALRDFVVPSQNFVYADIEGHIGYYASGRIPVRAHGDGAWPADGWSGEAEWIGWVPFEELPHTFDPPEHFLVSANNRPAPSSYPHLLGLEWTEPYRAQRIRDLLRELASARAHGPRPGLTSDDFAAIQADTLSLHARALLPILLARAHARGAPDALALDVLRQWNDDSRGDSRAAAIFQAWMLELTPGIAGDELGRLITADYMGLERSSFVARFLANTLAAADSSWCDNVHTAKRETCDDAVSEALHEGVVNLIRQLGADMSRWRWDAAHVAVFPHTGLDTVAVLRPLLSRSRPHGGDWSTVNVGPVLANRPFEQHSIPGYRQIVDLSPANDSRFLDAVGQSGHPLSKHYDDFLSDWQAVRHRKMRMNRDEIERGAIGHLRLVPKAR